MDSSERKFQKAMYKAAKNEPWQRAWYVYEEDYEFEVHENEGFVITSGPTEPMLYAPLRDEPGLFLRFARLAPADGGIITPEVMLYWAENYGLLGAARGDLALRLLPRERAINVSEGRAESRSHFSARVEEAARTLALYEAIKAPGGPDVETLTKMYSRGELMSPEELEEEALSEVWRRVRGYLETGTYLMVYELEDGSFGEGPGFHSLLAAMWIQMWWLLKAGDSLTHCFRPGCNSILDYEEPPEAYKGPAAKKKETERKRKPYKRRNDSVFCGRSCKDSWRYYNKKAGGSGRVSDILTDS